MRSNKVGGRFGVVGRFRGAIPTLGGRQFWSDVHFFQGWKIQQNVFTHHFRLLDVHGKRHESGTFDECLSALNDVRSSRNLPAMSGRAVVLIHGLIRSSHSFQPMTRSLQDDACIVVPFDYASTRRSIPDASESLARVLRSLEGIDMIDVVAHSMGGLVLRCFLRDHQDERLHRAVMMGVPNQGAELADRLHANAFYRLLYGPAGQELRSSADGLIPTLPVPNIEFGVIAGGRGTVTGFNPILRGDNDSTVTVRSTRLSGAADFLLLPVLHSFLMTDRRCIEAVRHFLEHGRFLPDREPQPIA